MTCCTNTGSKHATATYLEHLWDGSQIRELGKAARKEGLSKIPDVSWISHSFLSSLTRSRTTPFGSTTAASPIQRDSGQR